LHLHHTSLRNNHTHTHHALSLTKSHPIWWWTLHSSYPKVSKPRKSWENWGMVRRSWGQHPSWWTSL